METAQTPENQRERLNNLYRFQRHFYDLTRRFFLFGRDDLLREMNVLPGERVLEVGCGTGRNLLKLAQLQPEATVYGLDASDEMLKTAGAKLDGHNKQKDIVLQRGLAEEFNFGQSFYLREPFDKIFISYSLSMFPKWQEAITNALENLKPEGDLYILDFGDGVGLPKWLLGLRTWWLGLFKVSYRSEFLEFLKEMKREGKGNYTIQVVGTNYAFIGHFRKN